MWRIGKHLLLLLILFALFFWKVVFTGQFSVAEDWETANQGYAWHQFAASSIQKSVLPLWDPYAQSGRPHVGEMQPGFFYPLKLILYLWPMGHAGILSPRLFDQYYVLARFLAACFMFLLARELGLTNPFAAVVAGFCFGAGGFVGNAGGLQLLDSAVWLPFILLFLIKALRSGRRLAGLFYACLGGTGLAMTFLAGSIHLPVMDTIVVVTVAAFFALRPSGETSPAVSRRGYLGRTFVVVAVIGIVAFSAAAVQLLPSIEYAPHAYRWGSGGTTLQKTPYANLTTDSYFPPSTILTLLFGAELPAAAEGGTKPYLGVLPLLLAIIGIYACWANDWVKYLSALAVIAFFYGMGANSILHGVLYLLPFLDKAREADRFIYLTHFSVALLAGFGVEAIYASARRAQDALSRVVRLLGIAAGTLAAILVAASIFKPGQEEWFYYSFIFFIASWGVLAFLLRGHRTRATQIAVLAVIAADLYGFNWTARDRARMHEKGEDFQEQLIAAGDLAGFFHTRQATGDLFRVHIAADYPTNISLGDMFAVQTTGGQSATSLLDYMPMTWSRPGLDILNVRYVVSAGKHVDGNVVFEKGKWKVYETDTALPRAWIVSRTIVEPSAEQARFRIENPQFDARHMAIVSEPLEQQLSSKPELQQLVSFTRYEANRLEMEIQSEETGFLVLSEVYYPGWQAAVNGTPTKIYRADSVLRGIIVPPGKSKVVFHYRPLSFLLGAGLSALTLAAVVAVGIAARRSKEAGAVTPSLGKE